MYDYMQWHSNCKTFILKLISKIFVLLLFIHLSILVLKDKEAYVFCPVLQSLKYQIRSSRQRWQLSCHDTSVGNHFNGRPIFTCGCCVSWCPKERHWNWMRRQRYLKYILFQSIIINRAVYTQPLQLAVTWQKSFETTDILFSTKKECTVVVIPSLGWPCLVCCRNLDGSSELSL